jgi:hypothetical protein
MSRQSGTCVGKGTEDPDAPDEANWPHPIAHFDIKPGNSKWPADDCFCFDLDVLPNWADNC